MKIYHYTDLNGLKGIIESGSLWATNFSFLNDSNELTHGMNCLENALQYLKGDFNPKTLTFIEQALTHFRMHRAAHVYNLSFCLGPDLLSQWRGYGSSQGVCLEFDDEELIASLDLTHYQVFKNRVIYTKEDSTDEARNKILAFFRQPEVQAAMNADVMHEMIQATKLAHSLPPFLNSSALSGRASSLLDSDGLHALSPVLYSAVCTSCAPQSCASPSITANTKNQVARAQ